MADKNWANTPLLSKVKIGDQTYFLKDAEGRLQIEANMTAIAANAANIASLESSKQDVLAFDGTYDAESNKAATVATVTNAVKDITSFKYEVVEELPAIKDAKAGTIYLLKVAASGDDLYDEYLLVNGAFEKIGSTRIDLSNYYTKDEVDDLIDGVEGLVSAEAERAAGAEEEIAGDLADEIARATGVESGLDTRLGTAETKLAGIEAGAQVNKIEKIKLNGADLTIDADKRVDLGSIATVAALDALEDRVDAAEADIDALESGKEDKSALKALAYKDTAVAHVVAKTVSGVKATGTSTGELTGALGYASTSVASSGSYKPTGDVAITGSAIASASLENNTPVTVKSMATAGSVASFTEGAFTKASLSHSEDTFAKAGLVASVGSGDDAETLIFVDASTGSASLVTAFDGGSKAADSFTANVLPTFEDKSVMPSSASITTTAADLDAEFTGDSATIEVSGNYDKANLGTVAFAGKAIELSVGDITVPAQEATVE